MEATWPDVAMTGLYLLGGAFGGWGVARLLNRASPGNDAGQSAAWLRAQADVEDGAGRQAIVGKVLRAAADRLEEEGL